MYPRRSISLGICTCQGEGPQTPQHSWRSRAGGQTAKPHPHRQEARAKHHTSLSHVLMRKSLVEKAPNGNPFCFADLVNRLNSTCHRHVLQYTR